MTAIWDLTPAEEAALDDAYWNERYAGPDPEADEDDE